MDEHTVKYATCMEIMHHVHELHKKHVALKLKARLDDNKEEHFAETRACNILETIEKIIEKAIDNPCPSRRIER